MSDKLSTPEKVNPTKNKFLILLAKATNCSGGYSILVILFQLAQNVLCLFS